MICKLGNRLRMDSTLVIEFQYFLKAGGYIIETYRLSDGFRLVFEQEVTENSDLDFSFFNELKKLMGEI